ncbi:Uncharacterised protein [Vibrio cholerae]|nr:Uncharacterised protein [Vibrio cholerae]
MPQNGHCWAVRWWAFLPSAQLASPLPIWANMLAHCFG